MGNEDLTSWRVIDSGFNSPFYNMAVDEALIEGFLKTGRPVIRFYGWNPSGFSLGYSQKAEEALDLNLCRENNIPFVRRITGGSVIYHDQEVTYSLVCSKDDIPKHSTLKEGFKILCSFILDMYSGLGLNPGFACEHPGKRKNSVSSFCFSSFEDYDILIGGRKIGGNAQKRRKSLIFQHGSIPLSLNLDSAKKFVKEDLSGIENRAVSLDAVLSRKAGFGEISERLKRSFEKVFNLSLKEACLSEEEERRADYLESEKYRKDRWNISRINQPPNDEKAFMAE